MAKSSRKLEIVPGKILKLYSKSEAAQLAEQWLEVFGANSQGVHTKSYMWHVFSFETYPCVSGTAAVEKYNEQVATEFIVLSNDRKQAASTDALPQGLSLSDCYVFPENLAWTMAFTHEDGWLGPYFAYHPRYRTLHELTLARIKKQREAENARLKGWR
jgi:hypothetical protein